MGGDPWPARDHEEQPDVPADPWFHHPSPPASDACRGHGAPAAGAPAADGGLILAALALGIGDVLLAWENDACLALEELGEDQFDIVVPSVSVLAEPPVAGVEANIANDEQRALAEGYLNFPYSPQGQALAFKHYCRAWDASAAAPEDVARYPQVELVDIAHFGSRARVQPEHFGDGGIFDQICVPK